MKQIKIQEKDNFCLCSVLQSIFNEHNIFFSQKEISKKLTKSKKGFLADDKRIIHFLSSQGFYYFFYKHNEVPFNELDFLLEDMRDNHGIIGIKNHAYLLNNFHYPFLEIIDPQNNSVFSYKISSIKQEIENKGGLFGVLKYIL